jgi:hypothetical protein
MLLQIKKRLLQMKKRLLQMKKRLLQMKKRLQVTVQVTPQILQMRRLLSS